MGCHLGITGTLSQFNLDSAEQDQNTLEGLPEGQRVVLIIKDQRRTFKRDRRRFLSIRVPYIPGSRAQSGKSITT